MTGGRLGGGTGVVVVDAVLKFAAQSHLSNPGLALAHWRGICHFCLHFHCTMSSAGI